MKKIKWMEWRPGISRAALILNRAELLPDDHRLKARCRAFVENFRATEPDYALLVTEIDALFLHLALT
jgi:hypothetical protein